MQHKFRQESNYAHNIIQTDIPAQNVYGIGFVNSVNNTMAMRIGFLLIQKYKNKLLLDNARRKMELCTTLDRYSYEDDLIPFQRQYVFHYLSNYD